MLFLSKSSATVIEQGMSACMFQMNHPGVGLGHECSEAPMTTADCNFLITKAVALPGGGFDLCVQANDQTAVQSWEVINGTNTQYGNSPNECWNFTGSNFSFTITHYVQVGEVSDTCYLRLDILPDSFCQDSIVSASVENCDLQATINIDTSGITTPYVITFGDGSLAVESSSATHIHTYSTPGTYEICLSYLADPPKPDYITCCYSIEVQECTCPENIISVISVEPCTWDANMLFAIDTQYLPIAVDFGDSTNGVFDTTWITHDFPDPGTYNVCYSYEVFPGDTLTCCEPVVIPGCCLNADFTLNQLLEGPSCLNPLYGISNVVCSDTILQTTHIWEFSDSTVYIGPQPPDHLFTNFIDSNGEVCVTHTIICCGDTASYTACAPHNPDNPGAYLGTPGEDLFFSDILPFTGENVLSFIQQNANDPAVPLTIDGTLIADLDGTFFGGTWNMGRLAEVVVQGPNTGSTYRWLTLNQTVLQDAARINYAGCCPWQGIRSEGRTYIFLQLARITDALIALHYPGSPNIPALYMYDSDIVNNNFGIKSNEYVYVDYMSSNEFVGSDSAQVCECNAINAIDFRDATTGPGFFFPLTIRMTGTGNTVENFEQAFHFENSRLKVRGFDISDLQDYDPVTGFGLPNNPPGDAAIGIDFQWDKSGKSSLDIDNIAFHDFATIDVTSVAVRERISRGTHTLRAIASQPLASITTANLAGGYDLYIDGNAKLKADILGNDISTNGGPDYGFGITGDIKSKGNTLNVQDSRFSINSNTGSMLNGGVILASPTELSQLYKITGDTIDVSLLDGAGIGITNAFNSIVRRNTLTNGADIPGIHLSEGGTGLVDCNNVQNKPIGIEVVSSRANQYAANYLRANDRDMEFTGSAMSGAVGSTIRWNTFHTSNLESILYYAGAFTGQQFHNNYNQWKAQYGVEARHLGSNQDVFNSRFRYPFGHAVGTLMHPDSDPPGLFIPNLPNVPIDTVPKPNFCTSIFDVLTGFQDTIPDPDLVWEGIVDDTAYWAGLTAAEQTFMRQEIFGHLLEYPDWTVGSTVLSGFKTAQENGFVGLSETLKRGWQVLLDDISQHQASLEPLEATVDSLSALAQQWIEAMYADTTQMDSLLGLLTPLLAEGDSLTQLIEQADSLFFLTVQATVSGLLVQNAALGDSEWHQWCEKRYNEIALNWLTGTEPDTPATADLRLIAQTCLADGGRAVLAARGLCSTWLKEHYGKGSCQTAPQARTALPETGAGTAAASLTVVPNPANDAVRIRMGNAPGQEGIEVQVVGMDGRQMYNGVLPAGNNELTVPVNTWPEGIYVVKVLNGDKVFSRTFVVQHR